MFNTQTQFGDDPYFILQSCRAQFQKRLAEIVKLCGVTSNEIVSAFVDEVGETHDQLIVRAKHREFSEIADLTASHINLLGNDELELEIRIGELANRLKNNGRINHWRVQRRYMSLLNRADMLPEDNPLGLEPIKRGVYAICRAMDAEIEQVSGFVEKLDTMLQKQLPEIYTELDKLLAQQKVELAAISIVHEYSKQATNDNNIGELQPDKISDTFERVYTDPNLPDSVKAIVGRLYPLLLKRAVRDPARFSKAEDVICLSIEHIARAATKLPPDTPGEHPFCVRLVAIGDSIRDALNSNTLDISEPFAKLAEQIKEDIETSLAQNNGDSQPATDKSPMESAAQHVQCWLSKTIEEDIPEAMSDILSKHWGRVMENAYLADGNEGAQWKKCEVIVRDLLWSIHPMHTIDERKKLLQAIPDLLKQITAALAIPGISAEDREAFLDVCFDFQRQNIRTR